MYRCKLEELRKEKALSYKEWAAKSGVSVDTIVRIIRPENPDKDSPRVNTLEDLCKPLGVEPWEVFYLGDTSFVSLQAEIAALKTERDELLAENAILKINSEEQRKRIESLKDQIIDIHSFYMNKGNY